ncbi:MAG: methionyl-tRNA formyltransferase [Oscillospiraceae bacterium]|nr:methionyl-tRNA formyltransferase [Oscillospiraceae bacterium]
MRILFMGTPDFACLSLEQLYETGHDICGVFTQPDKPKNRGMQLAPPPVKVLASFHGTPVYQPNTLRDGEAVSLIRSLAPELIVVVAYGKILPKEILDLPPYGCINVHASLLPKYRGAAPIQWAVLNGEQETGVTIMHMAEGMDTGDMIAIRQTEIGPQETSGELFERLKDLGARLLAETIQTIADGTATRIPQDDAQATLAPPLRRDMSPVDWDRPADQIMNQIRGLNPWPVATAIIGGREFKLYAARKGDGRDEPGTVLSTGKDGLEIACGDGSVVITELQAPGKKRMDAGAYLRGNPLGNEQ